MDIRAKVFSSTLRMHAFKIAEEHSVRYQFESTPKVGYQDRAFTIKSLLNLRRKHNLPIFVIFKHLIDPIMNCYYKKILCSSKFLYCNKKFKREYRD